MRKGLRLAALAFALVFATAQAQTPALLRPAFALSQAERVADWQLAHLTDLSDIRKVVRDTRDPRGWQLGTFYVALTMLADRSASVRFREAILAHGRDTGWRLGERPYHADDHLVGSSYLWSARHGAGEDALRGVRAGLDHVVRNPSPAGLALSDDPNVPDPDDRWSWADALFMAPPTYFELTRATGDRRFAEFADREFRATTDFLLDPSENLYLRDSRFLARRDSDGRRIFWLRGNGWVFAALPRILQALPPGDPLRGYYEDLFRRMAARLKTLQRPDGFWSPSLLAPVSSSSPESSGTGFLVYGMAWGVNAGVLPRKDYESAIRAGWAALNRAVDANGKVGRVQQVGDSPEDARETDTQFYGAGAFLMAAAAVHDLRWR
jgi:rhamnogalacturonyl hydrolase YesR